MSMIYVLLPLALIFALGAVLAFLWALRDGQFDDTETPPLRILCDGDESPAIPSDRARGDGSQATPYG